MREPRSVKSSASMLVDVSSARTMSTPSDIVFVPSMTVCGLASARTSSIRAVALRKTGECLSRTRRVGFKSSTSSRDGKVKVGSDLFLNKIKTASGMKKIMTSAIGYLKTNIGDLFGFFDELFCRYENLLHFTLRGRIFRKLYEVADI